MNSSPTITKIAVALVKSQKEMGNAKKDAMNPFFKKAYADLNSVREAILPSLNANGISVIQPTCVIEGVNYVETILLHESGEYISSITPVITDKPNDAQRHGSGLSYARRYALASIANIGAEDDDATLATKQNGTTVAHSAAPVIKPATDNQVASILKRITACKDQEAGAALLHKAQESFTFTNEQAEVLVKAVNALTVPV